MTSNQSCFVWNVWGLNGRARRNVVREFLVQQRATVVCLQETKLSNVCTTKAAEILGSMFDYEFVPAANISGGIMLAWHKDYWAASGVVKGAYSFSAFLVEWNLWKERNARTFDRAPRQTAELVQIILDEASLWIAAGYRALGAVDALRHMG
jgi:exonuclease III